jgi:hypothetical protein
MLNTTQIPLKFHNSVTKNLAIQRKGIPLHPVSIMNGTVKTIKTVKRLKIIKIILLIMCITTSIAGRVSAQDSIRTQNFPDSETYSKLHLSFSPFWSNYFSSTQFLSKAAGLNYNLEEGTVSGNYTAGFAANLAFSINSNIEIVSGLELVKYAAKVSGNFTEKYETVDRNGDVLDFAYSLKNYKEQQSLALLSVPLAVRFSTSAFSDVNIKYFVSCGIKIGIPVVQQATITPGSVTTTGYFYRELELYEDFPEHGFVNGLTGITQQSRMDFKLGFTATLETGLIFMSNENISAGASIYCDMGLNNLLKRDNRRMVEYQRFTPGQLRFNSIMKTGHASSVETFSVGVKISIYFTLDKLFK